MCVTLNRSLLFVVVPTLISWRKTKIFAGFNLENWLKVTSLDIWMHRCQLFCHHEGMYLDKYIQVTKHKDILHPSYSESLFLHTVKQNSTFFYLGFLWRIFIIRRKAGEGGGYLFISFLPLPLALYISKFSW